MDTDNFFSLSRVAMVVKRDFMENWKKNLYAFIGMYAAFLFTYLGIMAKYDGYKEVSSFGFAEAHFETFMTIQVVTLLALASYMMENMRTKELRTAYLMLPATSFEKFVARACYVTLGVMLLLTGALFLAELTHFLFVPLFDLPNTLDTFVLPQVWERAYETFNPFQTVSVLHYDGETSQIIKVNKFFTCLWVFSIALWFHSLYILGGNHWYKSAFIKTTGIIIVVSMLLAYVVANAGPVHWNWLNSILDRNSSWLTEELVAGIGSLLFFLMTAFNWWLSYRLFARSQVIKPKFRLL